MIKTLRRIGRYITAVLTGKFNELADPKVQLEQAITEAHEQHRMLTEQAANVIGNQKQTEMRLSRVLAELESLNTKTRQAVMMADEAAKQGDTNKAAELTKAAESFAGRLVTTEKEVESLKSLHLQASQASDQAKLAVQRNSMALQKKLTERQKLLSQLDQAKMQERMNKAMSALSESVGQDVPTFEEVRDKIEARYAKALGRAELSDQTVEARMLQVEQASIDHEAQNRIDQIREQLGLGAGATAAGQLGQKQPDAFSEAQREESPVEDK